VARQPNCSLTFAAMAYDMSGGQLSARLSPSLGNTGASLIGSYGLDLTLPLSARVGNLTSRSAPSEAKSPQLVVAESCFFAEDGVEKDRIYNARHKYPKRNSSTSGGPLDFNGLDEEESGQRRIMGFGLGFEKIFATTSIKLPVSAYTIFVELHMGHKDEIFSRCFNGLHTVFDLKKWVFEKLLVPTTAYDLSYAEPGKATLNEQLRLLTTQDSLDTRTLATTRAVHRMYKGIPGVHSINDVGVTRLYVRLKCRSCGELLNSLQTCRKYKSFGPMEPQPDEDFISADSSKRNTVSHGMHDHHAGGAVLHKEHAQSSCAADPGASSTRGVPGSDPTIEDCWYQPDAKKHCLFHTRGFEFYEASRAHGGHADLARIYISCGMEPSKKLKIGRNVLKNKGPGFKISY